MRSTVAVTLSVIATVLFALIASGSLNEQTFGLTTVAASEACALVVTDVSAQGLMTGLHVGDMIDTQRITMHERLRFMVPRSTDHMMLPAHRMHASGIARTIVMAIPERHSSDAAYLRLAILFVLMLIGIYVLWRGRDAASLGLGIFFTMMPYIFLSHPYPGLPDNVIIGVLFLATALNVLGYFGLYLMIDALAAPALAGPFKVLARYTVVVALAVASGILFASTYGQVFTGCPPLVNVQIVLACYALVVAVCFVLLWFGITQSGRAQRSRLRWVFWATVVGYSGPLVTYAFISARHAPPFDGIYNVSFAAIPLGYSYAVLRHRVVDVGFVLNRALSLTILTSGIVAAFVVAESLIEDLAVDRTASLLIQLGFSLGLGMIFNTAQSRLEGWLERLLFRRRYHIEASLKQLSDSVGGFSNEGDLMREVIAVLLRRLALRGCAIYRELDKRYTVVELGGSAAFPDEMSQEELRAERFTDDATFIILPLRVHGRTYGGIVLSEDPEAESLASDERKQLHVRAVHLAAAVAVLRAGQYEKFVASMLHASAALPVAVAQTDG